MFFLQTLLNQLYGRLPELQEAFLPLHGQSIGLELTRPQKTIRIQVYKDVVSLEEAALTGEETLRLRGDLSQFLLLLADFIRTRKIPLLSQYQLKIVGDFELIQSLEQRLRHFEIDAEAFLTPYLGGTLAHHLVNALERIRETLASPASRLKQSVHDYFAYESSEVVRQEEFDAFCLEIANNRDALSRLEARITRLEEKTRDDLPS